MQLISPSRGLLIFTPVFLFSVAGIVVALRNRWIFPLTPYLASILVLHSLLISMWWPGYCYGSRYFTDMTPILMLFLIPVVNGWRATAGTRRIATGVAFILLALWGVFTHARGATSAVAELWSETPVSVDADPSRVWDWKDPQFLRGL
jgi:hypothetical protein